MALTYQAAVEQTITAGEQIHQIVNGTATTEVTVEDGSKVPSIRKALLDNFYFKDPIAWQVGQTENVFNQLRQFTDGSWWYAPSATASNPISMGSTPVGNPLWKIYDFDAIGKLTPQLREALRRSYAEAGYILVSGSFEKGGILTNTNDALLHEASGKAFTGPSGMVPAGTNPASGVFVQIVMVDSSVATYDDLRSYNGGLRVLYVTGFSPLRRSGVSGHFEIDPSDTTSMDNGGTVIVDVLGRRWKRIYSGGVIPDWFGAVPDYYMPDGKTVNLSPTDNTVPFQAAIDSLGGNGVLDLLGTYMVGGTLKNNGILTVNGDNTKNNAFFFTAASGKPFPKGFKVNGSALFEATAIQATFNLSGLQFIGNGAYLPPHNTTGTNKIFATDGKVWEDDSFCVSVSNCFFRFFGDKTLDGGLGAWSWVIQDSEFRDINGLCIFLSHPNNGKVLRNNFGYRNVADLKTVQGASLEIRGNQCAFDSRVKEYCYHLAHTNSFIFESNYMEQYGQTYIVNDGIGTFPVILEIDHHETLKTRAIRNNFVQLATNPTGNSRFITLRKAVGQDFFTNCNVDISGNGCAPVPNYFIYYEPPVGSTNKLTLNGVDGSNEMYTTLSSTVGRIYDANGLLLLQGENLESLYITKLVSPVNNTIITKDNCTNPISFASNFSTQGNYWSLGTSIGGSIDITYTWVGATADFFIDFVIAGNVFSGTERRTCKSGSGAGTFTITDSRLASKTMELLIKLVGGAGALCSNFDMQVLVK